MLKTAVSENLIYFLAKEDSVNHLPSDLFFGQRLCIPFMLHSTQYGDICRNRKGTGHQNQTQLRNLFSFLPFTKELREPGEQGKGMFSGNVV